MYNKEKHHGLKREPRLYVIYNYFSDDMMDCYGNEVSYNQSVENSITF